MSLKLASGSYDGTVKFWDPKTGGNNINEEIKLTKYNLIPNRIEVSENKVKLIVGMHNNMKIYDLNRNDTVDDAYNKEFKGNVTGVGFRQHDQMAYTSCEDGFLRIFDLRKKRPAKSIKQNKPINCAVMHPNGAEILSGDEAGYFRIWDLSQEKERISILSDNEVGIRSISVSQNGENIAFADSRGCIQPFYMEKGEHLIKRKPIQAHEDYILKL